MRGDEVYYPWGAVKAIVGRVSTSRRAEMLDLRWVLVAFALSACALPATQTSVAFVPATSPADCQRDAGVWRPTLNFCEYRSGC